MKLFFFDIDGTLAIGRDVPASAAAAIRQLRENGNPVFICTGRSHHYVRSHFGRYADGFICHNGRFAIMGDEVLYDHPVEFERIREISETVRRCGASAMWYGHREGWYCGPDEEYDSHREDEETVLTHRGLSEDMKAYSFNIFFPDRQVLMAAERALEDQCVFNPHGPMPHADVTVTGHDKGSALRAVRKALKVSKRDTYAFGDGINDLTMFAAAGHGIAMGNGQDRLKKKAEFVTTDINDDGIRNGLLHYGLIE